MASWFDQNPPPAAGASIGTAIGGNQNTGVTGGGMSASPQAPQGDPKSLALAYAQSLGPPSPENIQKTADYMKSLGYNVQANPGSDGFFLNGVGVDMVSNFHGQGPSNWQFLPDSPIGGSGDGGGSAAGYGYPGGTGLTPTQQIEQTPGYQFSVDQAMNAIQHSAAARGTLLSGGLMKNLGSYIANSVAGPAYQQQVGNLYNLAGLGKSAAGMTADAANAYGGSASGLMTGIGNAQAGATAAAGSGYGNAVTGIGNTAAQIWAYQHPQNPYQANASGYNPNGVNGYGVNMVRPDGN
jgi:hypothetical protein